MRQIEIVHLHRGGEVPFQRVTLHVPSGATVSERFAGLVAAIAEWVPDGEPFMGVRCDGCQLYEPVTTPQLPPGWVTDDRGDLCARCAA